MSRYDYSGVVDFLEGAEITPRELIGEIEDAMAELDPKSGLWHTLLTCADMLEWIEEI